MNATDLLADLAGRGAALRVEGGAIRYRCKRGALTADLREKIAAARPALIAMLAEAHPAPRVVSTEPAVTPPRAGRGATLVDYRLADNPKQWLVFITPGQSLDEARECLRRFWGDRLIEVQPR